MSIYPISYSSYNNSINIRKNLKNNSQIPENQVAFKGLEKVATKTSQETITKNSGKIFATLAGILGITTLQIKIANKKAQKEKEALKAKTIKELSEEKYAETKIFDHYPNEWVGKEYYYRYNQATCEGIAEFIDDSTVFHALRTVLDPSSHEDVPTRNLTKDEVIELGNAIKRHGIGLFVSYDCNYDRRSNKGAEIINQWKTGESLEDTINKIEKTKEATDFAKAKQKAQEKFGIQITEVFADSNPYKGDCHRVYYIHNGEAKICYLAAPPGGNTKSEVLEELISKHNDIEEFPRTEFEGILNKEALKKYREERNSKVEPKEEPIVKRN